MSAEPLRPSPAPTDRPLLPPTSRQPDPSADVELSDTAATLPPRSAEPPTDALTTDMPATRAVPTGPGGTLATRGAATLLGAEPALAAAPPGYELLGELGRGGMGVVYRARQAKLSRIVALKMILAGAHAGAADLARFRTEAEAIARLQHPNIVQVYEVGEHDGKPFFSLEFCAGGSLDKKLAGTPLPPPDAARLVETLARAMHAAHQANVIHRDLKPANVLLLADGTPKITDFGLAKKLDDASGQTQSGAIMGTPSYMAPEQAGGKTGAMGPVADVYALGAILYECLTGRPPFRAATPLETVIQVVSDEPVPPTRLTSGTPKDLETICLKCLHKEPAQRYASADALAEELSRFGAGEPILARPVGRAERLVKWARRRPAAAGLLVALILLALLAGALFVVDYGRRASDQQRALAEDEKRRADRNAANEARERERADEARGKAEQETRRADTLRERAEGLQELERRQRLRAETAEAAVQQLVYSGQLSQAQSAWQEGNAEVAHGFLDATRWDFRGWEYDHLRQGSYETHATLRGHTCAVLSVCFSPDGQRLASAGGQLNKPCEVKVWDAATGKELLNLKGHTTDVRTVCFSPDGRRLASAGADGRVKVWDAATGRLLLTISGFTSGVWSVCFSPDGKRLASANFDRTVKVWDAATGTELLSLKGHTQPADSVCFSPDGKRLASASQDRTVKVWDAATGDELFSLKGHTQVVYSVCFSPDGKRLASASWDRTVKTWDAATGQELLSLRGHTDNVNCARFSPDGKRLASASRDRTVKVWDAATGEELFSLKGHGHVIYSVCFSPDGKRLASASFDQTVRVWDAAAGQERLTLKGYTNGVNSVCFSPGGERLATGSWDKTAKVWDAATGRELFTLKGHSNGVYGVAFSPDGKRLASASADRTVRVWDTATGQELLTLKGGTYVVFSVCFSPDGKRLASASHELRRPSEVKVWDALNGNELLSLKGHSGGIHSVCFSPDGKRLASASADRTVKIWDAATGQDLLTLKGHSHYVQGVCFSPDGQRVASASRDQTVKVWDAASGQELLSLKGHISEVNGVCFSPDGKRLASGSVDKTVKVWDAATGQDLLTLKGHTIDVRSVCFSPDGKRLASASGDFSKLPGEVKVWDAATGRDSICLRGHTDLVGSVGFSPDGKRIVSQNKKAELRSWDAMTGQSIVPCTDPPPPQGQRAATSPDGSLRITIDGMNLQVVRTDDNRPSRDLVFLARLNDIPDRLRWHRAEAADSEAKQQWFAAAFHLRQLLAHQPADADKLRERLKGCEEKLKQP